MLRISRIEDGAAGPSIKLEGKLLAPWVAEIEAACQEANRNHGRSRLDLSAVTFVDADGLCLLERLAASGAELVHCNHFVATLLHREATP